MKNVWSKNRLILIVSMMAGMLFLLPACSLVDKASAWISAVVAKTDATPDPLAELAKYSDEELTEKIQGVVDEYSRAYNNNDLSLLQSVTDSENLPFKRLVSNRFTLVQESIGGGGINLNLTVESVQRLPLGFVRARVNTDWGSTYEWTFRKLDKQWLLSEPMEDQYGEPYEKETEHFTYKLYPWSDDINDEIIGLMENAAQRVEDALGALPAEKAKVEILPGYSADPFADPNSLAYYQTGGNGELDSIVIFTPYSYSFGWYDSEIGWQAELEGTLVHEYTHMTHQRAFDKAGKLMDWFSEGLAEYVSGSTRYYEIADALGTDEFIPIVDSVSTINQQDLNHIYLLEKNVSLAYAEAESLIWYIHDTYGGMESVWRFAKNHDELQDMDEAIQATFGTTLADFEQDWKTWLREVLLAN